MEELDVRESSLDVCVDVGVHLFHHLLYHLTVIYCTIISHVSHDSTVRIGHVPTRNIVALLVKKALIDLVVTHEVIVVVFECYF